MNCITQSGYGISINSDKLYEVIMIYCITIALYSVLLLRSFLLREKFPIIRPRPRLYNRRTPFINWSKPYLTGGIFLRKRNFASAPKKIRFAPGRSVAYNSGELNPAPHGKLPNNLTAGTFCEAGLAAEGTKESEQGETSVPGFSFKQITSLETSIESTGERRKHLTI